MKADDRAADQHLARLTGVLFLATFATSIPAVAIFYAPVLSDPAHVLVTDPDRRIAWGAWLEMALILANVGTALTLWPVLRRDSPVLSLGYVAARLTECGFIALGLVALLAVDALRVQPGPDAARVVTAQALVAIHDWTFRLGPGLVVGVGNGLILGTLMWRTRLVPRALSALALVGGPGIVLSGSAVLLGYAQPVGAFQVAATIPEFCWELGLGLWLTIRGFDRQALAALPAS
ncbi:MAG: DUF4386 domain-containing protein [Rhodobacteraceae bacterium]|nr:DUF4386 domain-containing protein [Paracoccaceae bacterium]